MQLPLGVRERAGAAGVTAEAVLAPTSVRPRRHRGAARDPHSNPSLTRFSSSEMAKDDDDDDDNDDDNDSLMMMMIQ